MNLSNFSINIIAQCVLGIASIIGLGYKSYHYRNKWEKKYNLKSHALKSSLVLSSCKLVWGMMVCHVFNVFTADIKCTNLSNTVGIYYPMYTLMSGFELGIIFIEAHLVSFMRKLGQRFNIIGLKFPDVYPNILEVIDIKYQKRGLLLNLVIFILSVCFYVIHQKNQSSNYIFIILILIGSIFCTLFIIYPFLLEDVNTGKRQIRSNEKIYYIYKKELATNIGSWVLIKLLTKGIWTIYIYNSSVRDDLCILAQHGVFHNRLTNAMFYMVFCSLVINIVSVCYQYIFMNGDKLSMIRNNILVQKCRLNDQKYLKKFIKNVFDMMLITLFSSVPWVFYLIEKSKNKDVNINNKSLMFSVTIFPWIVLWSVVFIKFIVLKLIKYEESTALLQLEEYSEL